MLKRQLTSRDGRLSDKEYANILTGILTKTKLFLFLKKRGNIHQAHGVE